MPFSPPPPALTQLQTIATPGRRYGSFLRPFPRVKKLFISTATRKATFMLTALRQVLFSITAVRKNTYQEPV